MEIPAAGMVTAISGLLFGLSLIVALGAQNTFLIQQGLRRQFVGAVVAVCTLSDLMLIGAGVLGAGVVVQQHPKIVEVTRWVGAVLLFGYAVMAVARAIRGGRLLTAEARPRPLRAVLLSALALTWLNPNVYLDTLLLTGTVAAHQGQQLRWWFAGGSMTASVVWFIALGSGARALSRVLRSVRAWRAIDLGIAVVMLVSAVRLVLG